MFYVLNFNPSNPHQDPWAGYYGHKPDTLPDSQVECTEEQFKNPTFYRVIDNKIVEKDLSEKMVKFKSDKLQVLKKACSSSIESGFVSSALGRELTYDSTIVDQTNLQSAIGLANSAKIRGDESWQTSIHCTTTDGEKLTLAHTADAVILVGGDWLNHLSDTRKKYAELAALVNSDETDSVEKLDAIVW